MRGARARPGPPPRRPSGGLANRGDPMRRRVLLRDIPLSIVLLAGLMLPAPPGARAQAPPSGGPAGGKGAPEGTGSPAGEAAPEAQAGAEPVVLSLEECLKQTLENSLDIAVRRYDPLKSGA